MNQEQIVDGKVEINQEYSNSEGNIVFQIVKDTKNDNSQLYLMHEAVFKSAYNKLFHLNDMWDVSYNSNTNDVREYIQICNTDTNMMLASLTTFHLSYSTSILHEQCH